MKKMLASAAVAVLIGGAAVTSAQAAPSPYPPTIKTSVSIKSVNGTTVKVLQKLRMSVTVKATGTAAPKSGKVALKFQRKVGAQWRAVTKAEKNRLKASRAYRGKPVTLNIGWVKQAGTYRALATFTPAAGTVFKPSLHTLVFRVKK